MREPRTIHRVRAQSDERPELVPVLQLGGPEAIRALQRSAGNAAVVSLVRSRDRRLARAINEAHLRTETRAGAGIDATFRGTLIQKVHAYNASENTRDNSQGHLDGRMAKLDEFEHLLYEWFEANKDGLKENPAARGIFHVLDAIQAEHKRIVGRLAASGGRLWVKGAVSDKERGEIDQIWADLVAFRGPFALFATVHTKSGERVALKPEMLERFKSEIYADFARLMSRPKGRQLIKQIHTMGSTPNKDVVFVMSPVYKILGDLDMNVDAPYVGAKATSTNEAAATLKANAGGSLTPGAGSGVGVEIAPGVHDASMMDFDREGNLIPSPAFVGIGHELIHGAHYQRGSYPGKHDERAPDPLKLPKEYGGDLEEFATIASQAERNKQKQQGMILPGTTPGKRPRFEKLMELNEGLPTEAEIREEHGIGIRHGHTTTANPILHPGAGPGQNPGNFVNDAIDWLGGEFDPPEEDDDDGGGAVPVAVGAPTRTWGESLSAWWSGL